MPLSRAAVIAARAALATVLPWIVVLVRAPLHVSDPSVASPVTLSVDPHVAAPATESVEAHVTEPEKLVDTSASDPPLVCGLIVSTFNILAICVPYYEIEPTRSNVPFTMSIVLADAVVFVPVATCRVPADIVMLHVKVLAPERISGHVALLCVIPVTFDPMLLEIVIPLVPPLAELFVIVPVGLTAPVEIVMTPVVEDRFESVMLPVPVIPPVSVKLATPAARKPIVTFFCSVIVPEWLGVATAAPP